MTELLSMFVVSDLHAIAPSVAKGREDSLLHLPEKIGLHRTPMRGLLRLIADESITADILVCCGDLTNRSSAEGFRLGWTELEGLADALGAESLVFTPGNHDIDSRDVNGVGNPLSTVESAVRDPRFALDPTSSHRLLVDGFEIYDLDGCRIVNVNSNGLEPEELEGKKGKVDLETIDAIEQELASMEPAECYILLCHHHPYRHGDIDASDYSDFENAPELFAMIERLPDAVWYMVHGHKHYPRIGVATSSATVFSAGSFSGSFYGPQQGVARNQCYRLSLIRDDALGLNHPPVVEFRAWDWSAVRWIPALDGFNIPRFGGFGARVVTTEFTARIADHVRASEGQRCGGEELTMSFPQLKYLPPQDIDRCEKALDSVHDIEVLISRRTGEWSQLGVRGA